MRFDGLSTELTQHTFMVVATNRRLFDDTDKRKNPRACEMGAGVGLEPTTSGL